MIPADVTVGVIGLGRMGSRIASNLAPVVHHLWVWNRTPSVALEWSSTNRGNVASSPAEIADRCDVIITMLSDGDALLHVYDTEMLANLKPGSICVDMGTSGPAAFHGAQVAVEGKGAVMIDAPVSGATEAAENAELLIMTGASPEIYEKIEPVLVSLGRPIRVGPSGSASYLKLAVNSVLYAINQSLSEAVVTVERVGIPPEVALETLRLSAAGAPMIAYRSPYYLDPYLRPVSFTLALAAKDLRLYLEAARRIGVSVDHAAATLRMIEDAIHAGFEDEDLGFLVEAARRSVKRDEDVSGYDR